jgi:hypothetical protein
MWALEAEALTAEAVIPSFAEAAQGTAPLRLATAAYHTDAADDPPDTLFGPRILGDVEVVQDVIGGLGFGGVAALTVGLVDLSDTDLFAADLARYSLADGRAATLRAVPVTDRQASHWGTPLRDTTPWWTGTVRRIDRAAGRRARISLGDITERLAAPLQPTRYAGTGGVEGDAALEGRPKPVCLGRVFNEAPVYVGNIDLGDGALPTFQAHWRAIDGVDAVRIRGAEQVATGSAPGVGEYRAYASLGIFQLGSTPDGDVTCGLRGDAAGGYVDTTAGVLWRLVTSLGPQLAETDRDLDSWLLADADIPHAVGLYQGAEETTAQAVAQRLLAGSGAVMAGGRSGRLRLFDPFATVDTIQFDIRAEWLLAEPVPVDLPAAFSPAPREVRVEWGRAGASVATPATSTLAALLERLGSGEAPAASYASAAIAARVAQHRTMLLPGLFWDVVGAQARADRIGQWAEDGPQAWTILTDRYLGQIEAGHMGRFTWPGLGLENGFLGVVVGWRERAAGRRLALTIVGVGV